MADVFDVVNALVGVSTQALFPNGSTNPVSPVNNAQTRVFGGWPSRSVDADLKNNILNVSVYPNRTEKNTSRFLDGWQTISAPSYAMTTTLNGQSLTFSGTPAAGINLAVFVNGVAYRYSVQPSDSLSSIAQAFHGMIAASTATGAVLTVANAYSLSGRVGQAFQSALEVGRTQRDFLITVWAFNPTVRDSTAAAIDLALRSLRNLPLADGSTGWIKYRSSPFDDGPQKELLFRRDLVFQVEYGTYQVETDQAIIIGSAAITTPDPADVPIKTVLF